MYKSKIRFILSALAIIGLSGCEADNGIGQFDGAVIESAANPNKFRQITFLISLHSHDNGYLVMDQIDSLKIYVNAQHWGTFASEMVDTASSIERVVNNIGYADSEIKYLFIAPYRLETDHLETAGDFVDYLNDRIVLTPGDYVCEIKEIAYKNRLGATETHKTQVFADFTVVQNATSSYVGDIEILMD